MKYLSLAAVIAFSISLYFYSASKQSAVSAPKLLQGHEECALDGMILANFSGPKAQIHYHDGRVEYFCEVEELFDVFHQPGIKAQVQTMFVQDTGKIDWESPRGGWIDALSAKYVIGSKRQGAMGKTFAPFSSAESANLFIDQFGGKLESLE